MNRTYIFALASAAIAALMISLVIISMQSIASETIPMNVIDFNVELDTNNVEVKRGESRSIEMYVSFPSSKGLKGNVIIEPDYVGEEYAKYISITADRYHIDIDAGKDTGMKRIVIQLNISVASNAKEGYYTYKVGFEGIDGKSSGMYLTINVK